MSFTYGNYTDDADHTILSTETEVDSNIYLFSNNNNGVSENKSSFRLYNMSIQGDTQGTVEGVNYVDYIQGDRNSYIDTEIVGNNMYKYELVFEDSTCTYYENFFGAKGLKVQRRIDVERFDILYNKKSYESVGGAVLNKKLKLYIDVNKVYINDILILEMNKPTELLSHEVRMYLFSFNPKDVYSDMKCYSFKTWNENNTLVQDLRPCLDTKGVPCMYDKVSKKYFYNQGTGSFSYSKKLREFQPVLDKYDVPCLMDKINRKFYYNKGAGQFRTQEQYTYKPVSYIQGDGNSYINTNITLQTDYSMESRLKVIDTSTNQFILGFCNKTDISNDNKSTGLSYRPVLKGFDKTGFNSITTENDVFKFSKCTRPNPVYVLATEEGKFPSTAKIYYVKIWDSNNNLVFNGIPVLDLNDEPCLYDKVSKQFFYNQGAGAFSYGIEEQECPKVDYVDSIKGNGQSCIIDTGLAYNSSYKYVINMYMWAMNSTKIIFSNSFNYNPQDNLLDYQPSYHLYPSYNGNEENHRWAWTHKGYEKRFNNGVYQINSDNISDVSTKFTSEVKGNNISFQLQHCVFNYYKVYDKEGNLLQDLRPCQDSKGVLCLYDSVSNKYFYNDNFVQDATLLNYIPIKYIQSDGTQYIDTGILMNNSLEIDTVCRNCSYKDYEDKGLVLCLDAISNTRGGHSSDTSVWEDLSGNNLDFNLNNVTIKENSISFIQESSSYAELQDIDSWVALTQSITDYTVELCIKVGNTGSYSPIISAKPGNVDVAYSIKAFVFKNTSKGISCLQDSKITLSCDMTDLIIYQNTVSQNVVSVDVPSIDAVTQNSFWIGSRLTGTRYYFTGEIYSIRIYNRKLTDEERLYNHSIDVSKYGVTTSVSTVSTDKYLMNKLKINKTYQYNTTDTEVQSNLNASEGATLTLGSTYQSYLSEDEIEQTTDNGWNIL